MPGSFADYQDGGWSFEIYYSESHRAWWVNCPDMEYDHGCIKPDRLNSLLCSYVLNILSIEISSGKLTRGFDVLGSFTSWLSNCVKDREVLLSLPVLDDVGFVNLLGAY